MNRTRVTQALFDLDGLLLDTEAIYTAVTQRIVARFGKTFDWSVKAEMIGRGALDASRHLVTALDLPLSAERFLTEREGLLREAFPGTKPKPGAERLVRHLHGSGMPIAVATSSRREFYEIKVSRHRDWFELFDAVVAGDDPEVRNAKPAPDIFLVAAARLGGEPASSLVFEDAPSGLKAGLDAGMRVVAVPDPNMDKGRYRGASLILDSLAEFDPRDFGLAAMVDRRDAREPG